MTTLAMPHRSLPAHRTATRHRLRGVIIAMLVAGAISACGDIVVGPVDHSCPTNPWKANMGSGCGGGGGH